MSEGYGPEGPALWLRVVGLLVALCLLGYGIDGMVRGDLHVSLSKSDASGVHLHGAAAWLCFAGMVLMPVGLVLVLGPELGEGEYDFAARRRRYGLLFLIGLLLYIGAQAFA